MSSSMDPQINTILYEILDQDPPERFKPINEILDEDPRERFKTLISDLSNPIKRSKAESLFNLCKETNLNTVVDKLRYLLEELPDIDVRKKSAILLGNIFEKFKSTQTRVVKDCLLNCLVKEENRPIIEVLGDTISKLEPKKDVADTLLDSLASDDIDVRKMSAILLGNIFEKFKSTRSPVKISCLLECVVKEENRPIIEVLGDTISKLKPVKDDAEILLKRLATDDTSVTLLIFPQLVQYVFDSKAQYMKPLHGVFKSCLGNVGSANVRIAALIAATSFIQRLVIHGGEFQDLLPDMILCLDEVLIGGDEAMKQKALVLLIKLAETKPSFFTERLVELVKSMLQIADTESLEEGTRNLAIEFVIKLVQYVINCELVSYIMPLHGVFKSCLENVGVGSANVRIVALIAATSFIQWSMIDGDSFQDLLPGMMRCLVEVLNGGDEAMKQKALDLLVKLAETKLSFFRGQLVEVFGSMLQIADTESLEEGTRNLAIEFVITLVEASNRGPDIHLRAMSAFLLGNLFKQCHPMSESTQLRVNAYLRACVLNEENKPIIEIFGYSISMLAPDEIVANLLLDDVATLKEYALLIFPHVVQYLIASKKVSNVQMASNVPFESRLRTVFKACLGKLGGANERIAALIAATSFIQCVKSLSDGDWFQDLLMQCLVEVLNDGDEAMTQKALVLLIELAETDWRFFNRQLDEVVGSMSQIAEAENLQEGTKRLAKKFAITLEAHAPDTSMPDMLEIVGNLLQFRLQDGIASDQTRTPAIEKLLKQFREKLPPKTWASTWSSLRLESILAHKEKANDLDCCPRMKVQAINQTVQWSRQNQCRVLPQLATYINDPDLRVRSAAINAYRQLFTTLEPDLQIKYLPDVLPVLDEVVRDYQKSELVRELAAASMIIICMNHPDNTSSLLGPTVAALLEASASSRSRLERVQPPGGPVNWDLILQEDINQDKIDRHQTTINNTSKMLLLHFKKKLPDDTWAEIQSSLSPELLDELQRIMEMEDRISSLPDCLLRDIISRFEVEIFHYYYKEERLMSTKEVINTTATISKRWQHLWTRLPNLIFIDYYGRGYGRNQIKYFSFIDKTLTQCPTDVKLNKFKLHISYDSEINPRPTLQVNSWIRHAITRNVQEVDLKIRDELKYLDDYRFNYDDEQFFNNSCTVSMVISYCLFNPPNGVRWDTLKFLRITRGELDKDSLEKILSGSPCLETLELNKCSVVKRNLKSLFENFVVERLSCDVETYKRFSYDCYDNEYMITMKLLRCESNPPNVAIRWDKFKFLCCIKGELDEDVIGKLLSGSPCLETLELDNCHGFRRIDITSKRFKNLVLTNHGQMWFRCDYIDTLEINAPYMLSLTIKGDLYLEKLLLLDMSSLVKADLDYGINYRFGDALGRKEEDIGEELLRGLLPSLGHVNDITLGDYCLQDLSRLRDKGFQFFKVGADGDEDRITELIASGRKKLAVAAAEFKKISDAIAAKTEKKEKVEEKEESDDDMILMSLFD